MGRARECCSSVRENILCYCLLTVALGVLTAVAVVIAAYGVLRQVTITVDDASLTRFDLATTPPTGLAYNLSLVLAVRNPNWAMTMTNKEPLEAAYSFDGQQFERVQLSDKGHRYDAAKTTLHRLVSGSDSSFVALGNAGVAEYGKQKANGTFEVQVKVTGKLKYTARYTKCKIEATCPLKLQVVAPPSANPEPGVVVLFEKVKCKLAKAEKYC
ncbi:hypothetical protein ACQ4PT_054126 [Festuca glaucescens]